MMRHHWRESIQSLYESQIDPENDEQIKLSKLEAENNFTRILKLAKERGNNRRNRNTDGRKELVELVEDLQRRYQLLYDGYDQVRGQLKQAFHDMKEDEGFYTATSSSESETDSLKDASTEAKHISVTSRSEQHEQESVNQEAALDSKQTESVKSGYVAETVNKAQETQEILQKLDAEARQLREKVSEKDQELLACRLQENEASAQIKELKKQLHSLNQKLVSAHEDKRQSEEQIGREAATAKQLQSEISELKAKVLNLENISKEKDAELSALIDKVNKTGKNLEHLSMHAGLVDQVKPMKHELESMKRKNSELESERKAKTQEILEYLKKLQNLEKELKVKTADYQNMKRENEGSLALLKDLRLQINYLRDTKSDLDKQIAIKDREIAQMGQEMEALEANMRILERTLKESHNESLLLQAKLKNTEADYSALIMALKEEAEVKVKLEEHLRDANQEKELLQERIEELEKKMEARRDEVSICQNVMPSQICALTQEVNHLQQEMDIKRKIDELISNRDNKIKQLARDKEGLQGRIMELELTVMQHEDTISTLKRHIRDEEKGASTKVSALTAQVPSSQNELAAQQEKSLGQLTQMGNQNAELTNKIADQQVILKQQEDTINRLREDCKSMKGRLLQAADRKMDEVAAEFRNNFEDKLRILSQRIKVAEQLQIENKESYKRMQDRCEQEHFELENKVAEYSKIIKMNKAELSKISDAANEMVAAMAMLIIKKLANEEGNFLRRLSKISNDIQVTKNWIRSTINEIRPSKDHEATSNANGDDKEQDMALQLEDVTSEPEDKMNKDNMDKVRLMRALYELQRKVAVLEMQVEEKEAGIVRLGEEKIEAIKQLCMSIEYHQTRCNHLMEMLVINKSRLRE